MRLLFRLAAACAVAHALFLPAAQAQGPGAPVALTPADTGQTRSAPRLPAPAPGAVLRGRVLSPAGALPGAVVRVQGHPRPVVTNAAGEFSLFLPDSAASVRVTASYAGFADETVAVAADRPVTVALLRPQAIKTPRKQRQKGYTKTARRQVKRTLRRL